jgi:hypothetical protein
MMVSFQRERLSLKDFENLQLLVEKFKVHNMGAPHNQGIPELNDNCAHVIHGPKKHNQGTM